jgi:hypothetical protein
VAAREFHDRADVGRGELVAVHLADDEVLAVDLDLVGDGGRTGHLDEVGPGPESRLRSQGGRTGVGAPADDEDLRVVALVTRRISWNPLEVAPLDEPRRRKDRNRTEGGEDRSEPWVLTVPGAFVVFLASNNESW